MTAQAQTKSNQLFDDITHLFLGDKKPNQLTLARIKREIESVRKVNVVEGRVLLGMVACLEVDVKSCKRHHELAISSSSSDVIPYLNYAKSLAFLGLSNEAFQQIKKGLSVYPHSPDLISFAIHTAIGSGHPADVDDYYDALSKIKPDMNDTEINSTKSIAKKFSQTGITNEIASSLMKLADGLILKNRLHSFTKNFFTDETGSNIDIYCWIEINANPAKVVEMNMELCEKIADDPYFCDKNTFSIAYRSR